MPPYQNQNYDALCGGRDQFLYFRYRVYKTSDIVLPPSDCSHLSLVSFPLWQIHTLYREHHMAQPVRLNLQF